MRAPNRVVPPFDCLGTLRPEVPEIEEVLRRLAIFETRLREGSRAELERDPEVAAYGDGFPSRRWDLTNLATTYLESAVYPSERLPAVLYHLMDLKLKLYWLNEPEVVNTRALVRAGYSSDDPRRSQNSICGG
jgi:hypothetical protein